MIFPSLTKNSLKKVKNVIQSLQMIWTNELQYLFVFKNHTLSFNLVTRSIAVCLSKLKIGLECTIYETSRISTIWVR